MRDAYCLKPKDRPAMYVKCKVPEFERNVAQVGCNVGEKCELFHSQRTSVLCWFVNYANDVWRCYLQILDTAKLLSNAGSFGILPVGRFAFQPIPHPHEHFSRSLSCFSADPRGCGLRPIGAIEELHMHIKGHNRFISLLSSILLLTSCFHQPCALL